MKMILEYLKKTFWTCFDLVALVELKIHERFLRSVRPHKGSLSTSVLKSFLRVDHLTRNKVIANYGMPLFNGLHPKNVFNFRYQFFLENITADDIVLDVACGSGLLLHRLSSTFKRGIGLERDRVQLEVCRTQHSAPNLSHIEGDIFTFNYAELQRSQGVNVALFSHILEHIEDVPAFLKLVGAPTILVCVPSQENWITQLKMNLGLPYLTDPTHFREYTRAELIAHLSAAGYSATTIRFNSEGEIACLAKRRPPKET